MSHTSLRQSIARIEGREHVPLSDAGHDPSPLALGLAPVDEALGGGLARAALHEVAGNLATASAFILGLATACPGPILWIVTSGALSGGGFPYAMGLPFLGLDLRRLVLVRARTPVEALWSAEEAAKCPGIAVTILELPDDGRAADLTATRRLSLAAREGGGLAWLLRHRSGTLPSAALTRWRLSPLPGQPDRFGGLGAPRLMLDLVKNRRGPIGHWPITWNRHDQRFTLAAPAGAMAAPAADRPGRAAARAHAG